MQEVSGSTPLGSTNFGEAPPVIRWRFFVPSLPRLTETEAGLLVGLGLYPKKGMQVARSGGPRQLAPMAQGSTGNVIAALASFFIPGLGQLLQGRPIKALIMFVLAAVLWCFLLGWIIHLWSIIDAALFKRPVA